MGIHFGTNWGIVGHQKSKKKLDQRKVEKKVGKKSCGSCEVVQNQGVGPSKNYTLDRAHRAQHGHSNTPRRA